MSEHQDQVRVFDVLRLNEAQYPFLKWIFAIPNGGARHPAVAGKLKAEGVKRGVSDICLPFPCFHSSRGDCCVGGYIEMKFGKNNLTTEQSEFISFVKDQGYYATVCYSADQALLEIETYCDIKLRGRR